MPSKCIGVHSQKKIGSEMDKDGASILDSRTLTNIRPLQDRYAQKLKVKKDLKYIFNVICYEFPVTSYLTLWGSSGKIRYASAKNISQKNTFNNVYKVCN